MSKEDTEVDGRVASLKLAFLDVGQADTAVVSNPETGEAIIIDCTNAKAVVDYLKQENIKSLRGVIITHLHADHYSGVTALLKNQSQIPDMEECNVIAFNEILNIKKLQELVDDDDKHSFDTGTSPQGISRIVSTSLQDLIAWREQNDSKYALVQVQLGLSRPYPSTDKLTEKFNLLHPHAASFRKLEAKGLNNTSVVLRVVGSGSSALLTGDIEPEGWRQLVKNHADISSDVLKFPHHGGAWGDRDVEFLLDGVNPSIVVISVGSEGYERYTHPNPSVFAALSKRPHIRILCTQATNQCQHLVISKRASVIDKHKYQASKNGQILIGSRSGCPCAGTIVIELGKQPRVLQPEAHFHQEVIIKPNFLQHQCKI